MERGGEGRGESERFPRKDKNESRISTFSRGRWVWVRFGGREKR